MQFEIVKIQEFASVCIYSICEITEDNNLKPSEYRDFKRRMSGNAKDLKQLQELNRIITLMGNSKDGATEDYFRREGTASALPSHSHKFFDSDEEKGDFGLRLYCVRVSNSAVILLNGGRKTTQNPEDCPNCSKHFSSAVAIANQFYEAMNIRNDIAVDGKEIMFNDNFYLNV